MRDDFFVGMLGGAFLMFVVGAWMIVPVLPGIDLKHEDITRPQLPSYKGDKLPMRPLASFSQYGFCWPHHGCEDV